MVGARITGVADLQVEMQKIGQRFQRKVIREASHVAALDLERHIVTSLNQGPATGKMRANGKSRASAPGEYPMTDMGILASSISTDRRNNGADVVARAPYAEKLEFKDPARGGRPFMRRGLQENENRIHQIVLWAARRILQRP
jgi:phage gpG-like protein